MKLKMKPISQIKVDLGINPGGRVQKFLTDRCEERMKEYVPKGETENLRSTVTKTTKSITYEMPYAHAQYIGIVHGSPVRNYTTPGTGPYWDKKMWTAEGEKVIEEVQKYVNRGK